MSKPLSDYTMSVLASIPPEPGYVEISDLIAEHGSPRGGVSTLSEALQTIRNRFGLVENRVEDDMRVSIPEQSWGQAEAEANEWWGRQLPV